MMNLTRYVKGTTTLKELGSMPNRYIHVIYKDYVKSLQTQVTNDKDGNDGKDGKTPQMNAVEAREMESQIEEAMGG